MARFVMRSAMLILSLVGLMKILQDGIQAYTLGLPNIIDITSTTTTTTTTSIVSKQHQADDDDDDDASNSSSSNTIAADLSSSSSSSSLLLCERINAKESLERTWERAQEALEEGSLQHDPEENRFGKLIESSLTAFKDWVKESLNYFTIPRLKRSILQQAPTLQMKRIIEIIDRRLQYLQEQNPSSSHNLSSSSSSSSSIPPPPLHVLVTGGSVTEGVDCLRNSIDVSAKLKPTGSRICAWPARLQEILDSLLGKDVVIVTNMAYGGTTSAVAALVLEHGLFPPGYPATGPDVIIWDHSANDIQEKIPEIELFEVLLQPYYQATRHLRCGPQQDQPLVIFLDSMLGDLYNFQTAYTTNAVSMAMYRVATWYSNVMGISYANTMRPYILSQLVPQAHYRLLGGGLVLHPGMMYHMTVAWVVLFNLLDSLRDACNLVGEHFEHESYYYNIEHAHPQDINHTVLSATDIPELNSALKMEQVLPQWKERVNETKKICAQRNGNPNQCEYVWLASRLTQVNSRSGLLKMIQPFVTGVDRWTDEGFPIRKPKIGWVATGRGAWFELTIPITKANITVQSFTLVAMKSYSKDWINSSLNVTATVMKSSDDVFGSQSTKNGTTVDRRQRRLQQQQSSLPASESTSSIVSGYHALQTSVWFSHKFAIPRATKGDMVKLRFELVDGNTFKISGMALCAT